MFIEGASKSNMWPFLNKTSNMRVACWMFVQESSEPWQVWFYKHVVPTGTGMRIRRCCMPTKTLQSTLRLGHPQTNNCSDASAAAMRAAKCQFRS